MWDHITLILAILNLVIVLTLIYREKVNARKLLALKKEIAVKDFRIEDQALGLKWYRDRYPRKTKDKL
jgi:hypothetical protein